MKKTKWGRRMLIAALAACLCVAPYTASADEITAAPAPSADETLTGSGYFVTHENAYTRLYCAVSGEHSGTFAVENKADGTVWYSHPMDADADTTALNIAAMKSLITFTYYDAENYAMVTANSYADSVAAGGLNLQKLKSGLRFNFTFPDLNIMVPLNILLQDDGSITARVEVEKIEENGDYDLFDITLLPYFCVASQAESGFALVPDGSGAVMQLNNGKTGYEIYNQPVYGGDAGEIPTLQSTTYEKIHMPIYGLQRDGSGIFTVITAGAAQSTVCAATAGVESDYNAVWNTFSLRKVTTYSLDQGWQGAKSFSVYQETPPTVEAVENRYWFLAGDEATLRGMAATYRAHLTEQGLQPSALDSALVVDYLGAVTRTKSVLGFPMKTKMVATSYAEAQDITAQLLESGVSTLSVRYLEWDSRSVSGRIVDRASAESKLGGKSDLLQLTDWAAEQGVRLYPDVDLTAYSKTSYPFQQYFDATKNMNLEVNRYFIYKRNIYNKDTDRPSWFTLNYKKLAKTSASFLKSYEKLGVGRLSLGTVAGTVTSDYSSKKAIVEPWLGAQKYQDLIGTYSDSVELMLSDAVFPHALYADELTDLPGSSDFDMLDYGVPFYQMVISGVIPYVGEAANLSDDPSRAVLQALQTGSGLHYALTCHAESDIVKDTPYDHWIGTDYEKWLPTIEQQYAELTAAYTALGSRTLVDYIRRDSGLTVSVYEGGGELWANDTGAPITDGDVTVDAGAYVIRKAGETLE